LSEPFFRGVDRFKEPAGEEKRSFTRIPFQSEAIVKCSQKTLVCDLENLSLNGLLLKTPEPISVNEPVELEILLSGSSSELSISLQGIVVRQAEEGVAVQFRKMDLDSFIHLKNVVSYNCGGQADVMEEFSRYIERKREEQGENS